MVNYGDWQFATYLAGLQGVRPELPMSWAELERRAEQALSPELWSYVAGGAGDERTQRVNVEAFDWWGLMPRMLVGAAQRDLSVQLFGRRLATPLLMAPVGVIALCDPDGHGDLATARAAAATGVPMVASTLMQDPLEEVAAALGDTPGYFQLYPPDDLLVGEPVEMLDQRPQRVAVRGDQDDPAEPQVRHQRVVPVRKHPVHHVGQALGARQDLQQVGVARVAGL